MMNNSKQAAVFNSRSTAGEAANGAFALSKPKGITALYSRLSNEDDLTGQSGSISNQMEILESYAKSQGFANIVHFCEACDILEPARITYIYQGFQGLVTSTETISHSRGLCRTLKKQ
jgi:hypothetical protein